MIKELLKKYEITIKSSASTIDSYLNDEIEGSKINILKKGQPYDFDDFCLKINQDSFRNEFNLSGDSNDVVRQVLTQISAEKKKIKNEKDEQRMIEAVDMKDGTTLSRGNYEYSASIQLFTSTPSLKINVSDYDFFANFRSTDDGQLLYKDDAGKVHFIMTSQHGLDFKNENKIAGEDSLWDALCRDLGKKYDKYCKLLNVGWAGMSEDANLEDVFTGFEHKGVITVAPTILRHYIAPKARFEKSAEGKFFRGFIASSIKQGDTMLFNDFMDALALNWNKWTKGCIKKAEDWVPFSNTDVWATNVYPLPKGWEDAKLPDSWREFFDGKAPERILHRVYFFIGSCLDAKNYNQQCLLMADKGGTGKGETTRMLIDIMPKGLIGQITDECLSNPRFAVSSHGIHKHHILVNTEYNGKSASNSELFKQLTGGDTISCEIKGGDSFVFNTKGLKMILSSNKVCYTKEHAIRRRLIPVSFKETKKASEGMSEMMKMQMRKDGNEFLKYCFKIYMKSPFRKVSGEYIVMNEEQEKEFLANNRRLPENLNYEKFLMKAFSADKDIAQYFKCGDYTEETHLNDDFEDIFNNLFVFDEKSVMPMAEFKKHIIEFCNANQDYIDSLDFIYDRDEGITGFRHLSCNRNKMFISYLEKTLGLEVNKMTTINGKASRVIRGIKLNKNNDASHKLKEKIDLIEADDCTSEELSEEDQEYIKEHDAKLAKAQAEAKKMYDEVEDFDFYGEYRNEN